MSIWPILDEAFRVARLAPPANFPVPMVLDTDTYNEVDDQFALVYSLLEPNLDLQAVYAAPFHNSRSNGPEDGMIRSYAEIKKLFSLARIKDCPPVFEGSRTYMTAPDSPVDSPAARDLIRRAMARPEEDPLYVVAIGCPVNVSSALLLEPNLVRHIVLVWLGGNPLTWSDATEFNLMQDIHASRVLFDSGVPMVLMPCRQVTDHLSTTVPELKYYLQDASPLGQYLLDFVIDFVKEGHAGVGWSKVIWDPITVIWLVHPESVTTRLAATPILNDNLRYSLDPTRPFLREGLLPDRDFIFRELFTLLRTSRINATES